MAEPTFTSAAAVPAAPKTYDGYRAWPDQTLTRMPSGVPYIIGNEAAERFSFYGMRSILIVFMTSYLLNRAGQRAPMNNGEASFYFHQFVAAVYFLPILGSILSDGVLGKYRTILWLSIVYCLGHFALALDDTRLGLFFGLGLISLGAGGIKPCVSAHVGDQFGQGNQHLLPKVFGWFYFSINAGSFISTWVCPILLNDPKYGARYAFGLPGIFMVIATVVFWMGRKKFVHVPPGGVGFLRELFSREGLLALARLAIVYAFIAMFWALWDQSSGGEWTLQAKNLDLNVFGYTLLPEQVQIANPILILVFIPLFNYGLYPAISRFFPLTPLRKIGIGLFLTAASFAVIWWVQTRIEAGDHPTVWWQMVAYVLLTAGEAMVSITGLEFSYTQAPRKMKSLVMAAWLFAVSAGNQFTAWMATIIPQGSGYFRFFTLAMLVTSVVYIFFARFYKGRTYIQGEDVAVAA